MIEWSPRPVLSIAPPTIASTAGRIAVSSGAVYSCVVVGHGATAATVERNVVGVVATVVDGSVVDGSVLRAGVAEGLADEHPTAHIEQHRRSDKTHVPSHGGYDATCSRRVPYGGVRPTPSGHVAATLRRLLHGHATSARAARRGSCRRTRAIEILAPIVSLLRVQIGARIAVLDACPDSRSHLYLPTRTHGPENAAGREIERGATSADREGGELFEVVARGAERAARRSAGACSTGGCRAPT